MRHRCHFCKACCTVVARAGKPGGATASRGGPDRPCARFSQLPKHLAEAHTDCPRRTCRLRAGSLGSAGALPVLPGESSRPEPYGIGAAPFPKGDVSSSDPSVRARVQSPSSPIGSVWLVPDCAVSRHARPASRVTVQPCASHWRRISSDRARRFRHIQHDRTGPAWPRRRLAVRSAAVRAPLGADVEAPARVIRPPPRAPLRRTWAAHRPPARRQRAVRPRRQPRRPAAAQRQPQPQLRQPHSPWPGGSLPRGAS